jgi:hypothetical protein
MALPAINATCPNCTTRFTGFPKRSFLGFQKLKCRKCSNDVLYPLTSGYRAIYRVILVLMVVGTWLSMQEGKTPTPGFLGIATIVALYQDSKLRKSTKPTPAPRVSPTT